MVLFSYACSEVREQNWVLSIVEYFGYHLIYVSLS